MTGTISIWSFALNILVLIVTVAGFIKIMKNDLVHLAKTIDEIKETLKEHGNNLTHLMCKVSKMEGQRGVRCSIVRKKSK